MEADRIPPGLWMEFFEATTWLLAHHSMRKQEIRSDTLRERVQSVRDKIKKIEEGAKK